MFSREFIKDFDGIYTRDVNLVKIKQQIIFELMYRRKERLRALLEKVDFKGLTGMNKHNVLSSAIGQLKQMSPLDTRLLDNVERQVRWVLDTYYSWIR